MKDADIVTDILERVVQAVRDYLGNEQGFEQATLDAITECIRAQDAPVRKDWGRTEPYIPARPPVRQEAKQRAMAEVSHTGQVAEASKKHGISRATLYRLLKK